MKTKCGKTAAAVALIFGVLGVTGGANAQTLPDTQWVDVTFYDFHSDRSNPEFEQPHGKVSGCTDGDRTNRCIRLGMVANELDGNNKPVLGPTPYRNYGIAQWFRDWKDPAGPYSQGKFRAPSYDPTPGIRQTSNNEWGATVVYNGDKDTPGNDTSFKNIVIKDRLPFILTSQRTGMYRFSRSGNNGFFWLDSRGFGNEWVSEGSANHNFSFTMELEFPFDAKASMSFNFTGDDDVWVFIDKKLVLDIGGIHSEQSGNFRLADVLDASEMGKKHYLRVFYAERHSSASNITIETNIVAPPAGVGISTKSNTSGEGMVGSNIAKNADDSLTLYSVVRNDDGSIRAPGDSPGEYNCNNVTWTINGVVVGTGCHITIKDSVAKADGVKIEVTYRDPEAGELKGATSMDVKALTPASIHIQRDSIPKAANTPPANRSDNIYFGVGEEEVKIYAVLRDKYGNFAGYAVVKGGSNNDWTAPSTATWISVDTAVATVNPKSGSSTVVHKEAMGAGTQKELVVTYRVRPPGCSSTNCEIILSDTVSVGSRNDGNIAIGPNPFTPGPGGKPLAETMGKGKDFYNNVLTEGGKRSANDARGVLIAVDAPSPLDGRGDGPSKLYGKVIIYDAVGNVVRTAALYASDGARSSYGYVWDGKNTNGRFVGPGTYLVRISGKEAKSGGNAVTLQRKVGVKGAK